MSAHHMPFLPPEALADERAIAAAAARAIALARSGESRAALALALHARRNAQLMETMDGEGEALSAAAMVHLIRGDAVAAAASAVDAAELARRSGNRGLEGHATVSLHLSACILGVCDDAVPRLAACAARAERDGHAALEVRARVALGVLLGDERRFEAAGRELARAESLACEATLPAGPARVAANIANLHRKRAAAAFAGGFEAQALHACDEAIREACRSSKLAAREGALAVEIDALAIRGVACEMRGEPGRGRALLERSIELGRRTRCPTATLWVRCELGRLALAQGDLGGAREAWSEALAIAEGLRPSRKIALACSGLAAVAAGMGEPAAAAEWRARAAREAAEFEAAAERTRRQLRAFLDPR